MTVRAPTLCARRGPETEFSGADSGYTRPMSDYDRRCLTFAIWYMQVMRAGR